MLRATCCLLGFFHLHSPPALIFNRVLVVFPVPIHLPVIYLFLLIYQSFIPF